jgi:putative spermidine/putrescine transport system substrate-binding protein
MGEEQRGLTRRELMKRGGLGAAGLVSLGALGETALAAGAGGGKFTGTLRVLGLGVDLIDPIKEAGEKALGFKLAFDVTDSTTMVQRAITQPNSFDVFSGYHYQYDQIWPAGTLLPVDTRLITNWKQITPLFKLGKVRPGNRNCTYGEGDAPFRSMYVDPERSGRWPLSKAKPPGNKEIVQWADEGTGKGRGPEPRYVNAVPGNFNMDSMGYNADVLKLPPEKVSWAQLLNPKWKGRVAVLNDPGIGMQDLANAMQAAKLIRFKDKGDMTRKEIDAFMKVALKYKKQGHFRAFWTTFNESVNFMQSKEVVIESMWSPAVALLQAQKFPVRFAAPPEGFRGWSGGQAIAKHLEDDKPKLDAAYAYINWWLSGVPGAIMMKQGYYNAVQETSRKHVEPTEYAFWILGKPAAKDLPGPFGDVSINKGQVRDGGSFVKRACKYSSWNSYFKENTYQVKRWNEFLSA